MDQGEKVSSETSPVIKFETKALIMLDMMLPAWPNLIFWFPKYVS